MNTKTQEKVQELPQANMTRENSVTIFMAEKYGMTPVAFESTLRATVMPSNTPVSREQFAAFLLVAKEYDLNPLTKEIYAFPAKGGGIQPIVSIDGWLRMINQHPQMNGMEFQDVVDEKGKLTAITCRIFRKDREKPTEVTEYMEECKRSTEPWTKWPARMLRHKATIQAGRYAFGLSGIYDEDEAARAFDTAAPATAGSKTDAVLETLTGGKQQAVIDAEVVEPTVEDQAQLERTIENLIAAGKNSDDLDAALDMISSVKSEDARKHLMEVLMKRRDDFK